MESRIFEEEGVQCKPREVSNRFKASLFSIYDYTLETFGYFQAERYMQKIEQHIDSLPMRYTSYPECRYLATKSRMYRNIILDSHIIIYRITSERIEVLDILHSKSSISKIRNVRSFRI
ncbi:MAG: type II toxin-antitoxin system RelE/ParE family toxin [Dysgonamonadaceae bacterium]|jgi:plasmid stabilization system protein ParE|nr:type II toxin-antitoxin system RelE/ParE family toxin [Dysgonamonadaceae bacterium]